MDSAAGAIPTADGGVMTAVIESAVGALLSGTAAVAGAVRLTGEAMEASAVDYHVTDRRQAEEMARLLIPGDAAPDVERQVAEALGATTPAMEQAARTATAADPGW